jgi:hypothetical protein
MWTPFGIPGEGYADKWRIEDERFTVTNVLLVMSVLVYVICQFRIFGLVHQAVAFEGVVKRKDEPPTRRPPGLIRASELGVMFAVAAGLVVFGHLVWWFVNGVEVAPAEDFPLRWVGTGRTIRLAEPDGGMPPGLTRFVVLIGMLFFGFLLARLVFGYWRLRTMGPAEGGMILLDGGWSETSRERQRLEKWRVWGRRRAEERAKKAEAARAKMGGKR